MFALPFKRLTAILVLLLMMSVQSETYGQCTTPNFLINQTPTVVGLPGALNTKYQRTNVIPGVDIEMQIIGITGTAVVASEDDLPGTPPAAPTSGYYEPWQPVIGTGIGTGTGGITWKISFFVNGSGFVTPYRFNCLSILALDVDGDATSTTREFVEAVNPYSYVGQSATTFLTYTETATTLRAQATTTTTITNIDSTRREAEMQFNFKNITSFTYTTGFTKTNTTPSNKQFSLLFRGTSLFTDPFVKYFNTDNDGTNSINEANDADDDNDGIPDTQEYPVGYADPMGDADGDNIPNYMDAIPGAIGNTFVDSNGDGINDNYDIDLDGLVNSIDLDADNDGIPDLIEAGGIDTNGNGVIDIATDADVDGLLDVYDSNSGGVAIANLDTDGDGVPNFRDLDSDNDGIPDVVEAGAIDANNNGRIDASTDVDGDGLADTADGDVGNDGTAENTAGALIITSTVGGTPGRPASYPRANQDANGLPNPYDLDSDNDGILDVREAGLTDATNDGIADGTLGADGWSDTVDALASLNLPNTDGSGRPNYLDIDADNDGIVDNVEAQSTAGYIAPIGADADADGIDDAYDNNDAAFAGTANNGIAPVNSDAIDLVDYLDLDSDNDGFPDSFEGHDSNGDNLPDVGSPANNGVSGGTTDADNDGLLDGYDNNTASPDPSNSTNANSYPNLDGGTTERDWREVADSDNAGGGNTTDIDDDNDGIPDATENGGFDPLGDTDADGIRNYLDPTPGTGLPAFTDTNADGINDFYDTDTDGIINSLDLDSDNDGIPDLAEAGGIDTNGDGRVDNSTDTDGDGLADTYDTTNGGVNIANLDTDGDGVQNFRDLDSDNDGIPDVVEAGGTDANNDGKLDGYTDTDGDGFAQSVDGDTNNDGTAENTANALMITSVVGGTPGRPASYPRANADGTGLPNPYDLDADNDGILDVREAGIIDANTDGIADGTLGPDGWSDAVDALPSLTPPNTDNNGRANYLDIDADNDGIVDNIEAQTTAGYVAPTGLDNDNDGIDNAYDNDDVIFAGATGNGVAPVNTESVDLADYLDLDTDNDGFPDSFEGHDSNGDNLPDAGSPALNGVGGTADIDGDGLLDGFDNNTASPDPTNGTTTNNYPNVDGGTTERDWREVTNSDNTGGGNRTDIDDDDDGLTDAQESGGFDPLFDGDGDGVANFLDPTPGAGLPAFTDANNDGINDFYDTDQDGIINAVDLDSDNDGIPDLVEAGGVDTNGDGRVDNTTDTDADGLADLYDVTTGGDAIANRDTDGDGIVNALDLDSDNDGLPDVVEAGGTDANNDGKIDGYTDTDGDGFAQSVDGDTNNDGTPDNTAAALMITGTDTDSDGQPNTYPRANADNRSLPNPYDLDADGDGILDVREAGLPDADNNGVVDGTLGADGWSDTVDALPTLTPTNSDADARPNYLDIDADNDGIVDNVEGQSTAGYIAPLNIDTDLDGIDDNYDNNDGLFAGAANNGVAPVNSDAIDLVDYLDLDSDNDGYPDSFEGHDSDGDNLPDAGSPAGNGVSGGTADIDNDGLLDGFDNNTASTDATNGTNANSYPNLDGGTAERDWREVSNTDNTGGGNTTDADDDNDGIPDATENGGFDPLGDADGDGVRNYLDPTPGAGLPTYADANNDGINDFYDADRDGIINSLDLDSDNDGIADLVEAGGIDTNGDGRVDNTADADGDGIADTYDTSTGGVNIANLDTDGDGITNSQDLDSDNDGIPDVVEAGATDANNDGKIDGFTDTDGDGFAQSVDGDTNNDGTADNTAGALIITSTVGGTPGRPASYLRANTDGAGLPNPYDLDADGDGILDVREAGLPDADNNGVVDGTLGADGWSDTVDALPTLTPANSDGDTRPNYLDIDADNDGMTDNVEGQTTAAYTAPSGVDTDGDGIDNNYDNDDAAFAGTANNGITPNNHDLADVPDYIDTNTDNDGLNDTVEGNDWNGNGMPDENLTLSGLDADGDGLDNIFDLVVGADVTIVGFGGTGSRSTAQKTSPAAPDRDWRNGLFVLPVRFIDVKLTVSGNNHTVAWTVADEVNVREYIVERSVDGQNYITVGRVAYRNNAGGTQTYTYNDVTVPVATQVVYYRIRQVDVDSRSLLSKVVSFKSSGKKNRMIVLGNPVMNNEVILNISSEKAGVATIQVMDVQGRMMYANKQSISSGDNTVRLTAAMASGTYYVRAEFNGQVFTEKIVINK